MWIKLALTKDGIVKKHQYGYIHLDKDKMIERRFLSDTIVGELEEDGFLELLWSEVNSMIDISDMDFFYPKECKILADWLRKRLEKKISKELQEVYEVMLDFSTQAVELDTGIELSL